MNFQLPAAILTAVILATIMNMNSAMPSLGAVPSNLSEHNPLGAVPSDLSEHNPLGAVPSDLSEHNPHGAVPSDLSEHNPRDPKSNITDNKSVGNKGTLSFSEWVILSFCGLLFISATILGCYGVFCQKTEQMSEAAMNRMRRRQRHHRDYTHRYNRGSRSQRSSPTVRFSSSQQISSPIEDNRTSAFQRDPFYDEVQENLRNQLQEEPFPRVIQVPGSRPQRAVPISPPFTTTISRY